MKKTITLPTLERYLASSSLSEKERNQLRAKFHSTGGDSAVLEEAVRMNGRKSMSKVPQGQTK